MNAMWCCACCPATTESDNRFDLGKYEQQKTSDAAFHSTCQNIKLNDRAFTTNKKKHWAPRTLPVCFIHKEPLEKQTNRWTNRVRNNYYYNTKI